MLYLGCDVHKKMTVVSFIREDGRVLGTKKFYNNITELKRILDDFSSEDYSAVLEAGLNWELIYEMLEGIGEIKRVAVAHPPRVKAIASAKIKTDKIDSKILGELLRADLIPEVWVPPKEVRVLKNIVRFRAFIVKIKTMIKNKVHDIMRKGQILTPDVQDLFGRYGREWLETVGFKEGRYRELLNYHLKIYDCLCSMEKDLNKWIKREMGGNEDLELVKTIPGIGPVFGSMIVLEIGDINRFPDAKHLCSYSGLVPSTHSSGEKSYHGRLINGNRWLRWAFIEGGLSSIRGSPYFRKHYTRILMHRGNKAAQVSVARKLASVTYRILKEKRSYREIEDRNNVDRSPSVRISQAQNLDSRRE